MGLFCFEFFFWGGRMCKVITSKDSPERDANQRSRIPWNSQKVFFQTKVTSTFWFDRSGGIPTILLVDFFGIPTSFWTQGIVFFRYAKPFCLRCVMRHLPEKKGVNNSKLGGGRSLGGPLPGKAPKGCAFEIPNSHGSGGHWQVQESKHFCEASVKTISIPRVIQRETQKPTERNEHSTLPTYCWSLKSCEPVEVGTLFPLFTGFYTSQVVGLGISEPSTVLPPFRHPPTHPKHLAPGPWRGPLWGTIEESREWCGDLVLSVFFGVRKQGNLWLHQMSWVHICWGHLARTAVGLLGIMGLNFEWSTFVILKIFNGWITKGQRLIFWDVVFGVWPGYKLGSIPTKGFQMLSGARYRAGDDGYFEMRS